MFIDIDGVLINFDHVAEAQFARRKDGHSDGLANLIMSDGRERVLCIHAREFDEVSCRVTRRIVSGGSGCWLIVLDTEAAANGELGHSRLPIIGWTVDRYAVIPITVEQELEYSTETAILFPNGALRVAFEGRSFDSISEWKRTCIAERAEAKRLRLVEGVKGGSSGA